MISTTFQGPSWKTLLQNVTSRQKVLGISKYLSQSVRKSTGKAAGITTTNRIYYKVWQESQSVIGGFIKSDRYYRVWKL